MLILKRLLISISLLACLSPSKTLASGESFDFHFEIGSESETLPEDCKRGIFAEFKDEVKSELGREIKGGEIDFYCVPKRNIFKSADPSILLFIPVLVSGDVSAPMITIRLPSLIEEYDLKPNYCITELGSCDPGKTRNKINRYQDVDIKDLIFLNQEFSPSDAVRDQLKTSLSVPLVRVLQHNLKVKGFNPGTVDGAWGPRTVKALDEALSNFSHDAGEILEIRYDKLLEFLFPNLFEFNSSNSDQESASYAPKDISESAPDDELIGEVDKPVVPNATDDNINAQDPVEGQVEDAGVQDSVEGQVEDADDNVSQEAYKSEAQTETNTANETDVTIALQQTIAALRADNEKLVERYKNAMMRATNLEKRLMDITDKSVIDLWERNNLKYPSIVGLDSANDTVELVISSAKFDERMCSIRSNISLKESFTRSLLEKNCFKIELENNEELLGSRRSYDPTTGILKIVVNAKQNEFISAVKTTNIEQFDEADLLYCYTGIRFFDKNQKLISIPFKDNVIELYDNSTNDGKTVLSFADPSVNLETEKLLWEDVFVELVDTDSSANKTCSVIPHQPFPIVVKNEAPKDNSPVAVIELDGAITLKNLPIAKSSPPSLHIFLDPLVGPTAESDLYGFNGAIKDPKKQVIQETYFKGFLLGVAEFLNSKAKFHDLSVYETQMINGARNIENLTNLSQGPKKNFGDVFKDEFVASYIARFVAGQVGEYDTKTEKISDINQENSNSYIISFGNSGSDANIVCGVELKRPGMVPRGIIFDVLPDEVIGELLEKDELQTEVEQFAFRCKANPRVVIFRLNQLKDYTNVQEIVAIKLKEMGI